MSSIILSVLALAFAAWALALWAMGATLTTSVEARAAGLQSLHATQAEQLRRYSEGGGL